MILGAAVWADGPSPTLRKRTDHAATVWHQRPQAHLVPCGGVGAHGPAEARVMRDLLIAAGVSPDRIRIEDQSTSTLENIRNARPILRELGARRVTIVTDLTHAPRAAMVARHFGLRVQTDCPPWSAGGTAAQAKQVLREACALPVYAWRLRTIPRD